MATMLHPDEVHRLVPADQRARPEGKRVVYLLRTPGLYDKTRLRRAITAAGGRQHGVIATLRLLRAGVEEIMAGGDAAMRDLHVGMIDGYVAAYLDHFARLRRGQYSVQTEEARAEFAAAVDRLARFDEDLAPVAAVVREHYQPYAQAIADDLVYPEIEAIEATRLFLVGWENRRPEFRRDQSGVPDKLLAAVPEHHRREIALELQRLMMPTEEEERDSSSPSSPGSTAETADATS